MLLGVLGVTRVRGHSADTHLQMNNLREEQGPFQKAALLKILGFPDPEIRENTAGLPLFRVTDQLNSNKWNAEYIWFDVWQFAWKMFAVFQD